MGIQLKDIMKIPPFSRAKLIGGKTGVGRIVESANIQEVPDVERWLHGGEILFSSGYAFEGMERVCEMMERLDKSGVSALVIKPGQYLDTVPQEMIECADRLELPLFELPEDLPYMDCIIPIFEYLMNEHISVIHRVENVHELLMQSMLQSEGIDGICRIMNQITGKPVFIFSSNGILLSDCADQVEDAVYVNGIKNGFKNFCRNSSIRRLKRNQCNSIQIGGRHSLICVPICIQQENVAHLVLDMMGDDLLEVDLLAFENASPLIALEILQEKALIRKEQNIRGQLLEDILMKRYGDESVIIKRGIHAGFDVTRPFCVFEIDADSFEEYLNLEMKNADEAVIQRIKLNIQESFWNELQKSPEKMLLMNKSVGVVGLMSIVNIKDDMEFCRTTLKEAILEQRKICPKLKFSAGIGRIKEHFSQAEESFREAKLALNTGRQEAKHRMNPVTWFEELGALCFLNELNGSQAMKNFYNENLGVLIEYDCKNDAELIKTLECYFQCNKNLRVTAETLFVHKNSIIYRIKKIEALLGKKLNDCETRFNLQLCLKIKDIL